MKIHDKKGLMRTILKWLPSRPQRNIFDGPISKSAYNTFLNTHTKFCAFITKCTIFLLCRSTKADVVMLKVEPRFKLDQSYRGPYRVTGVMFL